MTKGDLIIKNQRGLHARAASKFVKLAADFDAKSLFPGMVRQFQGSPSWD